MVSAGIEIQGMSFSQDAVLSLTASPARIRSPSLDLPTLDLSLTWRWPGARLLGTRCRASYGIDLERSSALRPFVKHLRL